jgi:hypothetical protein
LAVTDYRDPRLRRETFLRSWEFHLKFRTHPGCVHHLLPAIAEAYSLDRNGLAWLTWLNGNTQNPATSLLLLDESGGSSEGWGQAVTFWDTYFAELQWDTDRRYQKAKFGEATEAYIRTVGHDGAAEWERYGALGWKPLWKWVMSLPHMGRLSSWSMSEYARILLGSADIPDADDLMLRDGDGSRSHRDGLAVVSGYDAAYWTWKETKGIVDDLEELSEELLEEGKKRHHEAARLNLESALCTYKSWHKPNRRYPNVYADMAYYRIKKAEEFFGQQFEVLWEARRGALPQWARLEDNPYDPGLVPVKQNHYLNTGQPIMLGHVWPELWSDFDEAVSLGAFGERKD